MLALLLTALVIVAASVATGWLLLALLGESRPTPLAGAVGFAALTIACPLLIRLPGRATTAAIVVLVVLVAAAVRLRARIDLSERPRGVAATAAILVVLGCLPFAFNNQVGVLGEGIYTNDQAAQLYWTDWLEHGFGPEPKAVQFGYPTGPQALTATAAHSTGVELDDAFNGLLVAVGVLAGMAALAALAELPRARRILASVLVGMPYLAASFLAQSAFKETAMALFVLAFAIALERRSIELGTRARIGALLVLAGAAFFTYSVPGLVWFAATLVAWLVLELAFGGMRLPIAEMREAARTHRSSVIAGGVVILLVVVLGAVQGAGFVSKIGNVQGSAGRLSSPVWPGEALGIWPEGDFRIVRGEVQGAYLATLLGLAVVAAGAWEWWARRRFAGLAALGSAVAIYVGARAFASIYVQAKALAVMAPLVALVALGGLLAPRLGEAARRRSLPIRLRYGIGGVAAVGFTISTLLAVRAAPVGFPDRGEQLESLADRIDGHSVVFLGVDRFAAYWLRDTLIQSPGGYAPPEVRARPEKVWEQGDPLDLDTLAPGKLDRFKYAITTNAEFQSTAPPNLEQVARTDSYILWKRSGDTPRQRVLMEDGDAGRILECSANDEPLGGRGAKATVLSTPVVGGALDWSIPSPFEAPATAVQRLDLTPGRWQLSLSYASQVPLTVDTGSQAVELPPSLDGVYLTHQGEAGFWDAGIVHVLETGPVTVTVHAEEPNTLQRALGVDRKVWLGRVAATTAAPRGIATADACGEYLDHYVPGARG